ncbi:unnamed protein product [Orchesella dallaii]|uniref:Gustatory receptor n=1 Tax=Orchesella dallaii TaxID=48710 RepID=A0ABP1Q259_9HEXA
MVLIRYGVEIRRAYQSIKPSDPVGFFRLIETTSSFLCKFIAFYYFWRKREVFSRIVKFLDNIELPAYNPCKIQSTFFASTICIFYLIISAVIFLFDSQAVETAGWSIQGWFRRMLEEARYSYFLSSDANPNSNFEPISEFDIFISAVTAISIMFRLIVGFYMDLCILFCVLSLWTPVAGYCRIINEAIEPNESGEVVQSHPLKRRINEMGVIEQFKVLKHLSQLVSNAIGGLLLPAISEIAFGYALDFDNLIVSQDIVYKCKTLLFYLSTLTTLILAAEVCRKISCVKEWLCVHEDELSLSPNELMVVLDDIAQNEMGVSAGGRFIINYSFLGTMVTVLVTFLIIRIQSEVMASQVEKSEAIKLNNS